MDLSFLQEYFVPVIAGICLCIGFMVKKWEKVPNKYIPTIMGILGLCIAVIMNWGSITAAVILGGLFSGLASTGLYELFSQLINQKEEKANE